MMVFQVGEREALSKRNQSQYDCLFFDLDDTLYPLSSGIAAACRANIEEYTAQRLGLDAQAASELCSELYKSYGTTLAGLVAQQYQIDFDDFHRFVHGRLPYHVLKFDPVLRNLILSMPQRKWVFTNSDRKHAHKVLRILGLEDCFEGVVCFETIMSYPNIGTTEVIATSPVICKPSFEAIRRAIDLTGTNPSKTLFFDDSPRNIIGGKAAGLNTVLVGSSVRIEEADYVIESIHNIREAVPAIWEEVDDTVSGGAMLQEAIVVAA
eukprot:c19230_g1_i1 orf=429-1226(+)